MNTMETTLIGDNLYLFSFMEAESQERILNKQSWNYRGAVVLLDAPHDQVSPADFGQFWVPFWVQIHGLPIRAMNRIVAEELGALIGEVLEVCCDESGAAVGRCTHIRVRLDVRKPLVRWINMNIGGVSRKVMFRYEKLADFCYACGRLDHLVKHCAYSHPDGLSYYDP